jgi:Bacterial hydrolase
MEANMLENALPHYDDSVNTTGCCPKFNPEGWDGQEIHLKDKPFARATTKSVMHIPVNMGLVFTRVNGHIMDAGAYDPNDYIVLSRDLSPWQSEHLFAISKPVGDEEQVTLSGDFVTRVFEGPYRDAKEWYGTMTDLAREKGATSDEVYFFYTTCPKCAKAYGKNYVVGVARV